YSYLIGTYDPFIVVPASFTKGSDAAHVGDYAVVIAGSTIYPAMVGDVGPNDRVGEASLRSAKEGNGVSSPNNRPNSDITALNVRLLGNSQLALTQPGLANLELFLSGPAAQSSATSLSPS